MLKLVREYDWPVDIKMPEGGRHVTRRVTVRFRALDQDRIDELVRDGPEDKADIRLLREAVIGWPDDAFDDDGAAIPYSSEGLDRILQLTYVRVGMGRAYMRSLGLPEGERKN